MRVASHCNSPTQNPSYTGSGCCVKSLQIAKRVMLFALPVLLALGVFAAMFFAGLPLVAAALGGVSALGLGLLVSVVVSSLNPFSPSKNRFRSTPPPAYSPPPIPKATQDRCYRKGAENPYAVSTICAKG